MPIPSDPEQILEGLNPEQREAATATSGPLVILAGAGTGKTRAISHRVAYGAATGAIDPKRTLVVTFTEKAATEMRQRLRGLGLPQVQASTFHAAARRQLAHFWPDLHGTPLPEVLDSKLRLIAPLARQLPGGYRFTPARDLADAVEWAKVRRQTPDTYAPDRDPPVPADVFVTFWRRYERAKQQANRIDFEDMLTLAVELYEADDDARALVHRRYASISVDEYQDTNRLQEDLLRLWLGDRRDLCVVGDPDQTIYSFTGASAEFLQTFGERYPDARVVRLSRNYRSTPQVLSLANRLIPGRELRSSTTADGPIPELLPHPDADAEQSAVVTRVRALLADGVAATEIAILVRTNAQLVPFESALTAAGIPFTVRGVRFFARPDVRAARAALRTDATGRLSRVVTTRWRTALGFDEADSPAPAAGPEARDRHAALTTLLTIARDLERGHPDATVADYLAELARRDADEAGAAGDGVTLSTLHRAKGLEWEAVFLPQLEEGTLPIRQAASDAAALAEERRLLYVGITRARRHLVVSWAGSRMGKRQRASRFIAELRPNAVARSAPKPSAPQPTFELSANDEPLLEKLIEWRRERARADGVPAYIVADNKLLAAIATRRPSDAVGLLAVPGIGQRKAATYGDDILRIVRSA